MSGYGAFDDEETLPGMREADFEQRELERLGRRASALRKQGICVHGWLQTAHPAHAPDLKADEVKCLECGRVMAETDWLAERERLLG